jgi:hypothetical protein
MEAGFTFLEAEWKFETLKPFLVLYRSFFWR